MGSIAEPDRRRISPTWVILLLMGVLGSARAAQPILQKAEKELRGIAERWHPHVVRVTTVEQVKTIEFRSWKGRGERQDDVEVRRIFRRSEDVPGLIVDPDGYVLTSAETLAGAQHVVVTLSDERYFRARFVGLDATRGLGLVDIGPLEVDHVAWKQPEADRLAPGSFAVSLMASEKAAPVRLDLCFVSARGTSQAPREEAEHWLQVTGPAELRRGGTLVDLRGDLVGMIVAPAGRSWPVPKGVSVEVEAADDDREGKKSDAGELEASLQLLTRSASLASWWVVTAPLVRRTLDDLLAEDVERGKRPDRDDDVGWLGMKIAPSVPPELERALDGRPGAFILAVCENGPAKAAGLRSGDVVLRYGGDPVADGKQLGSLILASDPGRKIEISLLRDGEEVIVPVEVGAF